MVFFCKFDVTSDSVCNTTYDNNGNTIDSFCLTKNTSVAKSSVQNFNPIKIIPNPVTDRFALEYNSPEIGEATIVISDMSGNVVINKKAKKDAINFKFEQDMSKFSKGIYILQITVGNQKDSSLLNLK